MSKAPIWDTRLGFGGDGNPSSGPETLHHGHCVTDGPFANNTRSWVSKGDGDTSAHDGSHESVYSPHCLSRGFVNKDESAVVSEENEARIKKIHQLVSPAHVQRTLDQPDYDAFFQAFEKGAHNAIPSFIRGDWLTFSAPNGKQTQPCCLKRAQLLIDNNLPMLINLMCTQIQYFSFTMAKLTGCGGCGSSKTLMLACTSFMAQQLM